MAIADLGYNRPFLSHEGPGAESAVYDWLAVLSCGRLQLQVGVLVWSAAR